MNINWKQSKFIHVCFYLQPIWTSTQGLNKLSEPLKQKWVYSIINFMYYKNIALVFRYNKKNEKIRNLYKFMLKFYN